MVESVIHLLIALCVLAGLVYLAIWVFDLLGINLPPRVIQIVWAVVVLIAILLLWRAFGSSLNLRL